jgi:hypothetical protein
VKGIASHEQIGEARHLVNPPSTELRREERRARADDVVRLCSEFLEVLLSKTSASSVSNHGIRRCAHKCVTTVGERTSYGWDAVSHRAGSVPMYDPPPLNGTRILCCTMHRACALLYQKGWGRYIGGRITVL